MKEQPKHSLKVVVISALNLSDIHQDIALLKKHFEVSAHLGGGWAALPRILKLVAKNDVALGWFASTYTFAMVLAARLFGKRTLIQLGGVDTAADKELNYGIWLSRWKSPLVRFALRHADRVFAIHDNAIKMLRKNSGLNIERIELLPTGYDADFWQLAFPKQPEVLTVAKCDTRQRILIKGIDVLIETARQLPGVKFRVVGIHPADVPALLGDVPVNIQFIAPLPRKDLLKYYQKAKVYCQPSRHEGGFPNTLCEAMLCGCIPVGTRAGGIPAAIDHFGYLVEREDASGLGNAITEALSLPEQQGLTGRDHIARSFPLHRREERLIAAIKELDGKKS